MVSNSAPESQAIKKILDKKIRRSRWAMAMEQIWPRLWYPAGIAGIFVLFSLFDVWPQLAPLQHQVVIGIFGIAALLSLIPLARISWPTREQALRRLEINSGIPHRPASTYEDTINDDSASGTTKRIWQAHRTRIAESFSKLRSGRPKPPIERHDPFALRVILILFLTIGLLSTSDQAWDRIKAAFKFTPDLASLKLRIDAWVTPPIYTKRPPLLLIDGARPLNLVSEEVRVVDIPEKSLLIVRLNGADRNEFQIQVTPATVDSAIQKLAAPLEAAKSDDKNQVVEYRSEFKEPSVLRILKDETVIASWNINVIKDTPPRITLTKPAEKTARGSLQLFYKVEDDYGVVDARASVSTREDGKKSAEEDRDRPLGNAPDFKLKLPHSHPKVAEDRTIKDLTSHPWAGLKVFMTLEARDQAGQTSEAKADPLILPQRSFRDPFARAIIEQRKKLILKPWSNRMPVLQALSALTIAPDQFIKDKVVYLGLRSAHWRLKGSSDREVVSSVVALLWDVAIRLEDGDLSELERALREAQEKLAKALEEGASDEEIRKRIAELRKALNEFLQALARNNQNQQAMQLPNNLNPNQMLNSQDLEQMLRNIENLARSGARDAAQQMLSQLQNMLENLRRGGRQRQNAQNQQMMDMMNQLGEMIARQQQLLDETFQAQRQGSGQRQGEQQQGQQGQQQGQGQNGQGNSPGGLQQRQQDLAQQLQNLLDQLRSFGAKPPGRLEGARRSMGEAGNELGEGNLGPATDQQRLALDQLRQGAQQMVQQMMRGMQRGPQVGRANRDPLGRQQSNGSPEPERSGMVPGKIDTQRAREILEELRRRLSEPTRPSLELDYIERLLRQF